MNPTSLIIVGICYVVAAYQFWNTGKEGLAVAFVCYAIANFGFLWEASR